MNPLFKAKEAAGYQDVIKEGNETLNYLALGTISLLLGETFKSETGDFETVLVILSGKATVLCAEKKWNHLGDRNSVFDGKATVVYIPCDSEYQVISETNQLEIAVCKVKAEIKF